MSSLSAAASRLPLNCVNEPQFLKRSPPDRRKLLTSFPGIRENSHFNRLFPDSFFSLFEQEAELNRDRPSKNDGGFRISAS